MNNQSISSVPDENRIEELLGKIQPMPSEVFHKKMEQADWRNEQIHPKAITNKPRLKLAVALVVLLAIVLVAVTPQGRAWAQEIVQFFRSVDSTTIPLSQEEIEWMYYTPEEYELPLVQVLIHPLTGVSQPDGVPGHKRRTIVRLSDCLCGIKAWFRPAGTSHPAPGMGIQLTLF